MTTTTGETSQLKIYSFYDRSELIEETILTLESALWLQILITIAIVLLILRRLRICFIISLMLPISVLLTFIAMKLGGVDANIVALSGIAIAIGTVVDMGVILTDTIINTLTKKDNDDLQSLDVKAVYTFRETSQQQYQLQKKLQRYYNNITTTIVSFLLYS